VICQKGNATSKARDGGPRDGGISLDTGQHQLWNTKKRGRPKKKGGKRKGKKLVCGWHPQKVKKGKKKKGGGVGPGWSQRKTILVVGGGCEIDE